MWERFTERARAAVYFAQEEASSRGLGWIGPECLLLGLLHDEKAVAVAMLRAAGVDLPRLAIELNMLLPRQSSSPGAQAQLTPAAKRALDLAYAEARALGCDYVGTEHVLLGLACEGGDITRLLGEFGISAERLRGAIQATGAEEASAKDGSSAADVENLLREDPLDLRGVSVLSLADLNREQIQGILQLAEALRRARGRGEPLVDWQGRKSLALLFEKPSLRTRVTFELGMRELGGVPVVLGPAEVGLGKRESVADAARNLDRWVSAICARVFAHDTLVELHRNCSIPVINALSDREHPCQALADLQTLTQHKGRLEGLHIAWVGDGNNVLHSLMIGAAAMGASVIAACPAGYEPDPFVVATARHLAGSRAEVQIVNDPKEAVAGADAVYTDVWASMGHEDEAEQRRQVFEPFRVTPELMARAASDAVFMHCLPAHRGEEVTDAVLDGPQSVVLDQAETRLHAQKALLALLLGP